jgi:trans-2,3-dihydro-3-hydroxyanthranilate isomerase
MTRSYRYLHYDVFTDHLFGGNQLAVVLDGRGLSGETMQAIAKEMNFSETTFVLPSEKAGTDVRMRIFTPGEELPTAGHPTIGSTFALARTGVIDRGRERFVFGCGIGPVPVTLTWKGDELSFAWMSQAKPVFGPPLANKAGAAAALSLSAPAVAGTGLPVQVVSCGVPFCSSRSRREPPLTPRSTAARSTTCWSRRKRRARRLPVFRRARQRSRDRLAHVRAGDRCRGDPATGIASGPLVLSCVIRSCRRRRRAHAEPAGREDGTSQPRGHRRRVAERRGDRERTRGRRSRAGR